MSRMLATIINAIILILAIFIHSNGIQASSKYIHTVSHIVINNDSEFRYYAHNLGWKGNGSEEFPYIIENYILNNVYINNTTVYFVLRNNCIYSSVYGVYLNNVSNGIIEKNVFFNIWKSAIFLNICKNINVRDNYITCTGVGMEIYRSRNVYIENNSMLVNLTGIMMLGCERCYITSNYIGYAFYFGIQLWSAVDINITKNTVDNCTVYVNPFSRIPGSIDIRDGYKINISHNNIKFSCGHGISIWGEEIKIFDNVVENSRYAGISLESFKGEVLYNTLIENSCGISVRDGENIIAFNIISQNGKGIYVDGKNNKIYFNMFYNNSNQSEDCGLNNTWNWSGIGNFWSGWNGLDINDDGIIDEKYPVNASAGVYDFYPLSEKFIKKACAPTNLDVLNISFEHIDLYWNAPKGYNYSAYHAFVRGFYVYKDGECIAYLNKSEFNFSDYNISLNKTYRYYITSDIVYIGESYKSNILNVSLTKPSVVRNLTARVCENYVMLSWEKPNNAAGLSVYRVYIYSNNKWILLAETQQPYYVYFVDDKLGIFKFKVTAVNLFGEGEPAYINITIHKPYYVNFDEFLCLGITSFFVIIIITGLVVLWKKMR